MNQDAGILCSECEYREQMNCKGRVQIKKMFGEYMVYINDKPILLVCDNSVFVKKLDEIKRLPTKAQLAAVFNVEG